MQLPTLPTDNLYKFLALAGITAVLLSLWFLVTTVSDLKLKVVAAETQKEILNLETKSLERAISVAERMASPTPEAISQLRVRTDALEIKRTEFNGQGKQLQSLVSDITFLSILLSGLSICGIALAVIGFRLWYQKVQYPNDMLLIKELESSDS